MEPQKEGNRMMLFFGILANKAADGLVSLYMPLMQRLKIKGANVTNSTIKGKIQMKQHHICSWRGGPVLAASIRKLVHNPNRIVEPYLSEGMTAMDIGCGMGFFTIPMSGITGKQGNVIAVDLQPEMLAGLQENAEKAGCENITFHQCGYDSLNISLWNENVDFALIFMMLHEVPDADRLIREVYNALAPGGKLLFSEPIVHVEYKKFQHSVSMIQQQGFNMIATPRINICRSVVFQKGSVQS